MPDEAGRLTKEEWIERLKNDGRDKTIRDEMIRLGFWTEKELSDEEKAQIDTEETELKQLQGKLGVLKKKSKQLGDINFLIQQARKQRIVESRKKRAERKKERERQQAEAKQRWQEYQATHVIHVGRGYSENLTSDDTDEEKLKKCGHPLLRSALEMAEEMGISLSKLKWLTYHRNTSPINHYVRFTIPKKRGGTREISAPKPDLRQAQTWIKEQILDSMEVHPQAFGFIPGKNTVEHAKQHVRQAAVVKMDLQDFFPSITFWRVQGLFRSFGYNGLVSTLLALICTEAPRQHVTFRGKDYYVALAERQLPQGACTSPQITNILCRRLDQRLDQLARSHGFTYSRYADDITFSCDTKALKRIGTIMKTARNIIDNEGFIVNEEKTRVLRSSRRQKVTGIVVNDKPNLSRKDLRNFRALLHNVEKNGLKIENRNNHPDFWGYIQGYTSYVQMVHPEIGNRFADQVQRIGKKYGLRVKVKSGK